MELTIVEKTWLYHEKYGGKIFNNLDVGEGTFIEGWRDSPDRFGQSAEGAWEQWKTEKPLIQPAVPEVQVPVVSDDVSVAEVVVDAENVDEEDAPNSDMETIDALLEEMNKKTIINELRSRQLPGNFTEKRETLAGRLRKALLDEIAEQ